MAKLNSATHRIFQGIVLNGVFGQNGMASFANVLKESDVTAIQHYLVKQQMELYEEQKSQ